MALSWEVDRRMKRRGNKIPQPRSDFIGGILLRDSREKSLVQIIS